MRIVSLMENTPGCAGCSYEHGLSVYLETEHHKILADTGASGGFLHNAERMDVDLSRVDILFLSHGHYDHAGGILDFVKANPGADIYMQRTAGGDYYAMDPDGPRYIGIDKAILDLPNLHLLAGDYTLDEEVTMLAGIDGRRCWSKSNLSLKRLEGETFRQDSFDHEQALVVRQGQRRILFSGCAHNGILNVLDRFRAECGGEPDMVISGFHFMKDGAYTPEEIRDIQDTARELARMNTVFYSGHCTSQNAFDLMKDIMGEKLQALHSGLEILE